MSAKTLHENFNLRVQIWLGGEQAAGKQHPSARHNAAHAGGPGQRQRDDDTGDQPCAYTDGANMEENLQGCLGELGFRFGLRQNVVEHDTEGQSKRKVQDGIEGNFDCARDEAGNGNAHNTAAHDTFYYFGGESLGGGGESFARRRSNGFTSGGLAANVIQRSATTTPGSTATGLGFSGSVKPGSQHCAMAETARI